MLRIDAPFDERNTYGWYQDSAYDKLNSDPLNACILWCPLVNTNKSNGTLVIMPKSHNEKTIFFKVKKTDKFSSKQINIPYKYLKKYKEKSINVKANDSIVTYSNLFHKSGFNSSKKARFTFIVRFNKILSKDYLSFRRIINN